MPPRKKKSEKQQSAADVVTIKYQLIELVRHEPIIYDRGLAGHHDADMVTAAWERIAETLGVDDGKFQTVSLIYIIQWRNNVKL